MRIISHRGNIKGQNPRTENDPKRILHVIEKYGFDVEVDVHWLNHSGYYLGHDGPVYPVSAEFLRNHKLWCHAKDLESLESMLNDKIGIHCFWHEEDQRTLTSKGFIWTYPGRETTGRSVIVTQKYEVVDNVFGVCTDYPLKYLNRKW